MRGTQLFLPSQLRQGVAAAYDFQIGVGPNVPDVGGNGNNGTWQGTLGSQWGRGPQGGEGIFNGSNNYVALNQTGRLPLFGSPTGYSISAWILGNTDNRAVYTDANSASATPVFLIYVLAGGLRYGVLARNTSGTIFLNFNSFYPVASNTVRTHICWTDTGGRFTFWVNGVLDTAGTYTPSGTMGALNTSSLGGWSTTSITNLWSGRVGQVIQYRRVISPNDVQTLYSLGQGKAFPFT